jgi:hypothetical protein
MPCRTLRCCTQCDRTVQDSTTYSTTQMSCAQQTTPGPAMLTPLRSCTPSPLPVAGPGLGNGWILDGGQCPSPSHPHPIQTPFPNPLRGILRLGPSMLALHHRQSRHVDQRSPSGGDSTAPGERAVMARSARDDGRHVPWRDDNFLLHRGPISCHDVTMGGFSKHGKQEKPAKFTLPSIAGTGFSGGTVRRGTTVRPWRCSHVSMLQCPTRYGSAPVLQSSQLLQCSNGPTFQWSPASQHPPIVLTWCALASAQPQTTG